MTNTILARGQAQTLVDLVYGFLPGRPVAYGQVKREQYSKKAHGAAASSGFGWTAWVTHSLPRVFRPRVS